MSLPQLYSFIRPVGTHAYFYCYRVMHIIELDTSFPRVECERWGMENRQPFDDGHKMCGHVINLLPVRRGVWSVPPRHELSTPRWVNEIYYVAMDYSHRGQGVLF